MASGSSSLLLFNFRLLLLRRRSRARAEGDSPLAVSPSQRTGAITKVVAGGGGPVVAVDSGGPVRGQRLPVASLPVDTAGVVLSGSDDSIQRRFRMHPCSFYRFRRAVQAGPDPLPHSLSVCLHNVKNKNE